MLAKSVQKIKNWVFDEEWDELLLERYQDNPLSGYLKLAHRQHQSITGLYRVLIFAFMGFLLLIGFLIANSLESNLLPLWSLVLLALFWVALVLGSFRALRELKLYKRKSQASLAELSESLNRDQGYWDRLKNEQGLIHKAQKILKKRLKFLDLEEEGERVVQ